MAGYTPIALSLTPFSLDDQTVPDRAFDYLVSTHQMSSDLQTSCARLVFDRNTGEWIDTVMITDSRKTVEQLVREKTWICLNSELKIGKLFHFGEVFFFPVSKDDPRICLEVKLVSYAYEAVYNFVSSIEGDFNESAKRGLTELCCGLAAATKATAFMLHFYDTELLVIEVKDIVERLRSPDITLYGKRPGLITGIQNTIMSLKEMESIWGKCVNVYENIAGYVILDSLQPFKGFST